MSAMAVAHASELLRIPVPPDQIVRSILLSTSLCVSPLPLTLLVFVLWVDKLILYLYVKENGPSHAFSLSVFLFFFFTWVGEEAVPRYGVGNSDAGWVMGMRDFQSGF